MTITQSLFYFLAFVAVFSSLLVVLVKNPVHSVLYLILTFFALTGEYVLLNAQFIAVVNIIVYAGAIMVLFLFVIMLLNLNVEYEPQKNNLLRFAGIIIGGIGLVVLTAALKATDPSNSIVIQNADLGLVENLGQVLFRQFLLPFEIVSILFLSAMVGAVLLARKEPK
ncbi:NADH-quinone oxidoreductase subunit J family protein [Solitalea canadensis]|uniref:NADH-quinone oxidoreductase subunit J n=1 Tax=Solitalea canadensis (strain ATCC 29591 / DSM 3403 / JCM 21819 / LMG 8368 / NBRC 15130 / NCIMB 12057 / USAM 9D) TaxID=929556 RepID=H8KMD6_SOLCM|nr:NADH-quinone oxidoreductase subunit J [Solitalea canadensis]AFD08731.1 NADH:ubiquinone oxidoreductase subunit 6 (chain J) [Solitalea canadensis DSM 3403]